jgi:hypothetical protein
VSPGFTTAAQGKSGADPVAAETVLAGTIAQSAKNKTNRTDKMRFMAFSSRRIERGQNGFSKAMWVSLGEAILGLVRLFVKVLVRAYIV